MTSTTSIKSALVVAAEKICQLPLMREIPNRASYMVLICFLHGSFNVKKYDSAYLNDALQHTNCSSKKNKDYLELYSFFFFLPLPRSDIEQKLLTTVFFFLLLLRSDIERIFSEKFPHSYK